MSLQGTAYRRRVDGSVETAELRPELVVELKSGHRLTTTLRATHENLDLGFGLPEGTEVLAGGHYFTAGRMQFHQSSSALFRVTLSGEGTR